MISQNEIAELISTGKFEYSYDKSNTLFQKAAKLAEEWVKRESGDFQGCIFGKEAFRELALNNMQPTKRTSFWNSALKALHWIEPLNSNMFVDAYAELVVDVFQDEFSDMSSAERHRLLRCAKVKINSSIDKCSEKQTKGLLLARKSSIIRQQALGLQTEEKLKLLSEAHRCSSIANDFNELENAAIILELGLVEWALARLQKTDQKYVTKLQLAENIFLSEKVKRLEIGQFALSRFYRLTYRFYDACSTFPLLTGNTKNRRRLLRDSEIYAESAIQLSNLSYPETIINEHINKAIEILELSIASGCKDARKIISLAFLRSIKYGVSSGLTAIEDICYKRGEWSWEQVLKIIRDLDNNDLPSVGLALGVNSGAALTRLGTFANRFLENEILAESLYRAAVRSDFHDPVAQTNLARFLVKRGEESDLREARRVLQLAQSFSDRRFHWWRYVLLELDRLEGLSSSPSRLTKTKTSDRISSFKGARDFKQIRRHYRRVKEIEDPQRRGYELEFMVYLLANLSFGTAKPSYRVSRPLVEKIHQYDDYFEHRGEKYRCECKWQKNQVNYDDIVKFIDKIDVVGVSGLVVSMSGFNATAIKKCKEVRGHKAIILMDGDEIESVMKGIIHFDDIMTIKRLYFDLKSTPYYKTTSLVNN